MKHKDTRAVKKVLLDLSVNIEAKEDDEVVNFLISYIVKIKFVICYRKVGLHYFGRVM